MRDNRWLYDICAAIIIGLMVGLIVGVLAGEQTPPLACTHAHAEIHNGQAVAVCDQWGVAR